MGRRTVPPVAGPTGKRRLVELAKDVLIVLLFCSAAFLAGQTPMASRFRGWVAGPGEAAAPAALRGEQLLQPYAMAARNSLGLFGVSYDDAGVERALDSLGPFFGEALASAGTRQSLTGEEWTARLDRPGACCAFQEALPLELLAGCLEEGGATSLSGSAETLLLTWDGTGVELSWREGEGCYAARTALTYEGHFEPVLEGFSPNGAAYAGLLAESDPACASLAPEILVTMGALQPADYTAATPDFLGDEETLGQLLSVLEFQSGAAYTDASGGLAINEGGDRLRVSPTGSVTFYAGEEGRYFVPTQEEAPSAQEAALAAGDLLSRLTAPWRGEGRYVLTGVEAVSGGWQVTFHTRLGGIPVLTGETGWCARFTVTGRQVAAFTVQLRSYTPARTTAVVPPQRLAAAALNSLPEAGGRLMLAYTDPISGAPTAGWVARS